METTHGIAECVEAQSGASVSKRTESIAKFKQKINGLGPPTQCSVTKQQFRLGQPIGQGKGFFHYSIGRYFDGPAEMALYFTNLQQHAEPVDFFSGIFAQGEWRVTQGVVCCFDVFTRTDVHCNIEVPGGVTYTQIINQNNKADVPDEIWKNLLVSEFMRSELYDIEFQTNVPSVNRQQFIQSAEQEATLIGHIITLFQEGIPQKAQKMYHYDQGYGAVAEDCDLLLASMLQYFRRRQRLELGLKVFQEIKEYAKHAVVYEAALLRYMGQNEQALTLLEQAALSEQPDAIVLVALSKQYLTSGMEKDALELSGRALVLCPEMRAAWFVIAHCYATGIDMHLALVALNQAPVPYKYFSHSDVFGYNATKVSYVTKPSKIIFHPEVVQSQDSIPPVRNQTMHGALVELTDPQALGPNLNCCISRIRVSSILSAYNIILLIVSSKGWEDFLDTRTDLFVMQEDMKKLKGQKMPKLQIKGSPDQRYIVKARNSSKREAAYSTDSPKIKAYGVDESPLIDLEDSVHSASKQPIKNISGAPVCEGVSRDDQQNDLLSVDVGLTSRFNEAMPSPTQSASSSFTIARTGSGLPAIGENQISNDVSIDDLIEASKKSFTSKSMKIDGTLAHFSRLSNNKGDGFSELAANSLPAQLTDSLSHTFTTEQKQRASTCPRDGMSSDYINNLMDEAGSSKPLKNESDSNKSTSKASKNSRKPLSASTNESQTTDIDDNSNRLQDLLSQSIESPGLEQDEQVQQVKISQKQTNMIVRKEDDVEGVIRGDMRLKKGKRMSCKWLDDTVYALWQDLCDVTDWKLLDKYLLNNEGSVQAQLCAPGIDISESDYDGFIPFSFSLEDQDEKQLKCDIAKSKQLTHADWYHRGQFCERLALYRDAQVCYRVSLQINFSVQAAEALIGLKCQNITEQPQHIIMLIAKILAHHQEKLQQNSKAYITEANEGLLRLCYSKLGGKQLSQHILPLYCEFALLQLQNKIEKAKYQQFVNDQNVLFPQLQEVSYSLLTESERVLSW